MAALSQPACQPSAGLVARIAEVREQLTDACATAGLRGDPYCGLLEVYGECLGLTGEVAQALDGARSPLSPESTQQLINQTARQGAMAMAGQLDAMISAWRWRALAVAATAMLLAMVMGIGVGWFVWAPAVPWTCADQADGGRLCWLYQRLPAPREARR